MEQTILAVCHCQPLTTEWIISWIYDIEDLTVFIVSELQKPNDDNPIEVVARRSNNYDIVHIKFFFGCLRETAGYLYRIRENNIIASWKAFWNSISSDQSVCISSIEMTVCFCAVGDRAVMIQLIMSNIDSFLALLCRHFPTDMNGNRFQGYTNTLHLQRFQNSDESHRWCFVYQKVWCDMLTRNMGSKSFRRTSGESEKRISILALFLQVGRRVVEFVAYVNR